MELVVRSPAPAPPAQAQAAPNSAAPDSQPGRETESGTEMFIRMLEIHQRACEAEGRYIEADSTRRRIIEARVTNENKKREQITSKHIHERLALESQHLADFQQFNEKWTMRIGDNEAQAEAMKNELKEKHMKEMMVQKEKHLSALLEVRPKLSRELLDHRRKLELLAHQKQYLEAEKVKAKIDALEAEELEKAKAVKKEQNAALEEKLLVCATSVLPA
ncbi:hypothetical protein CBR_g8833 [Chara braunii]|uniref:Uncharacterized protein n=1 Tax=Chara braunii TaxID=69332 RepID=A0A388KN95_CHABU|nr:hypothetical protein CBR_g8833 [Chara braunii]|eukprot:GBG71413.1 hypothetical protein CBR_g8833 [Chara braunii]